MSETRIEVKNIFDFKATKSNLYGEDTSQTIRCGISLL